MLWKSRSRLRASHFENASPQFVNALLISIVGPEYPGPTLAIECDGWTVEIASTRGDRDRITPLVVREMFDDESISARGFRKL